MIIWPSGKKASFDISKVQVMPCHATSFFADLPTNFALCHASQVTAPTDTTPLV